MPAQSPMPVDTHLTQIAIAVKNTALIADEVLPRTAPMNKSEFKYQKYPAQQGMTVPDTKVGRTSGVNRIDFEGVEITDSTKDYGLESVIPSHDQGNSYDGVNLKDMHAEYLSGLIGLDREVRVSAIVSDVANYADNHATLAAANKFSNDSSDPLGLLEDKLNAPLVRPNIMVISQAEWSALRRHPKVVKAVHGNSGDSGLASRKALADLLELEDILVGTSRVNTANIGQSPSFERAWTGCVALLYRNKTISRMGGQGGGAFGFTAQYATKVAGSWEDKDVGLRGGTVVRVGESVKEVVCGSDFGFLIKGAV